MMPCYGMCTLGDELQTILSTVKNTLVQPMESNMLSMRDVLIDRVEAAENHLVTSTANITKFVQDTAVNVSDWFDIQLGAVRDNTTVMVQEVNGTFTAQIASLQQTVEGIINTTLEDIQKELILSSTELRLNISTIEESTIPQLRQALEEGYKLFMEEAVTK